jgi:DNA-binding NtrC family response regulator
LNMVEFNVPPLRKRVDDIPHFVDYFSRKFAARYQRPLWRPTSSILQQFCDYRWPGNIRQLANIIEQAYVLDCEPKLPERPNTTLTTDAGDASLPFMHLGRLRRVAVRQALRATQGHKSHAAKLLGVHPNTMTRLLAQLRAEESSDLLE